MIKKLTETKAEESKFSPSGIHPKYFHTFDLGCSAALISSGFKLVSLDKQNPKKVKFAFIKESGIDQAVTDYWSDKIQINARTFFDNVKMLKNRIYSD
ncbi:hypothetical protein A2V56_03700 [Candidatus Woesebacteria bacterium RBG_19FT_COMBO_42_9]|nr:MAG: hypothetical protein A2V56_03700 [Candidatus Woesebacteria bacterium RBG_19FT_COMBO_42_9]